jgi:hypothetical protein
LRPSRAFRDPLLNVGATFFEDSRPAVKNRIRGPAIDRRQRRRYRSGEFYHGGQGRRTAR